MRTSHSTSFVALALNSMVLPTCLLCQKDAPSFPISPSATCSWSSEAHAPEKFAGSHAEQVSCIRPHRAVANTRDYVLETTFAFDACDSAKDVCFALLDLDPISCGYYYGHCKANAQTSLGPDSCTGDPCGPGCPSENCSGFSAKLPVTNEPPFTTMLAPAAATSGNLTVLAAIRPTGVVSYSWWNLGQARRAWTDLDPTLNTSASPAVALVGNYLFVVAQRRDQGLYLNQGSVQGNFTGWQSMSFRSDGDTAISSSGKITVAVARDLTGHLSYSWWQLGQRGSPWTTIPANLVIQTTPTAMLIGNYLFVVARASDGSLYLNQGALGRSFVGWQQMGFSAASPPSGSAFDETSVVLAKNAQGVAFYNWWDLGGKGGGWKSLGKVPSSNSQPIATLARGHYLFVALAGKDGHIYINQGVLGGAFTGWR